MSYLNAIFSQHLTPDALPGAVRSTLGKPLRRAAGLTQLAVIGALNCLPEAQRHLPTALLWQSNSGPRQETLTLLDEVCCGPAEPMPYDFLATQPAIAAAQLKPFLPGLHSAMHLPQDEVGQAYWSLLITLAGHWLAQGRYAQVLCAQLDHRAEGSAAHWLALAAQPLENPLARLQLSKTGAQHGLADSPDFPERLGRWLNEPPTDSLYLHAANTPGLTVEFARL